MDLNAIYDDIMILKYKLEADLIPVAARTLLEYPHNKPDSDDYRKVKAFAAACELQNYLANVISVKESTDKQVQEQREEIGPVQDNGCEGVKPTEQYVSDTKVLWQSAVVEGSDSDIILLQHGDGRYGFDVNVGHEFNSRQDEIKYMQDVLSAFTAWMKENGYATDRILPYDETFIVDFTYNSLQTVEEVYCMFKMAVLGFCNC